MAGSLSNAWSLLWIRKLTGQKWLWVRTIGSTLIGETADTVVFCTIAFIGTMGKIDLLHLALSNIIFKIAVEAICTPVTYRVIAWMKKAEPYS